MQLHLLPKKGNQMVQGGGLVHLLQSSLAGVTNRNPIACWTLALHQVGVAPPSLLKWRGSSVSQLVIGLFQEPPLSSGKIVLCQLVLNGIGGEVILSL